MTSMDSGVIQIKWQLIYFICLWNYDVIMRRKASLTDSDKNFRIRICRIGLRSTEVIDGRSLQYETTQ